MILDCVDSCRTLQPLLAARRSSPTGPSRGAAMARAGGCKSPRQCSAFVRWHVWYEHTYSASSMFWPAQKTRRRNFDPSWPARSVPRKDHRGTQQHLREQPAAAGIQRLPGSALLCTLLLGRQQSTKYIQPVFR